MKVLFLLLFVTLTCATTWIDRTQSLWSEHKKKYNWKWSLNDEMARFKCFVRNLELIEQFNQEENGGATYGLNQFAHLCHDEFKVHYKGLLMPSNRTRNVLLMNSKEALALSQQAVDWRQKGAVTKVRDQGQCGSCWAFSAVGNMEGQHFLKTGQLVELSEEELVQCSGSAGNQGCAGGLMDYAFDWVAKNGGIASETDYPYSSKLGIKGNCRTDKEKDIVASFTGHIDIAQDEVQMAAWIATNGPLSVAVDAGPKWQLYKKGIKKSCWAGHVDHGVLIVGFGEEGGVPYWIVKNSWGPAWGEDGYIRIKRGSNCNSIRHSPSSAKS